MAQYQADPHHFVPMGKKSRVPYLYCVSCGLINMKNEFSEWAVRMGCNHKDHPSYENKRGITNPFN